MTEHVYALMFTGLLEAGWYLTDDAHSYIFQNLDYNDETSARHLLRRLVVPVYEACDPKRQHVLKTTLQWYINCADEDQLRSVIDGEPDWAFPYPDENPRLFYEWMWLELFGDEPWESDTICSATLIKGNAPRGDYGVNHWGPPIPEDVLFFPRKDGLPPGTDAPEPNKPPIPPPLPRRPTDGGRFFRWEDQAKAIKRATKVHKKGRQQKVWVEFEFPIGEGYQTGGGETVWETNYACVRFHEGKPVDSWPDLRKGWQR